MLDEMTLQNTSKYAIFFEYEKSKTHIDFFISCHFIFSPNGQCRHRPGHSLGKNEKNLCGFTYLFQKCVKILKCFTSLDHVIMHNPHISEECKDYSYKICTLHISLLICKTYCFNNVNGQWKFFISLFGPHRISDWNSILMKAVIW